MLSWLRRTIYRLFPFIPQSSTGFSVVPIKKVYSQQVVQPIFISDIPQRYTHLLIECVLRVETASTPPPSAYSNVTIKFNRDGLDGNYHSQYNSVQNGQHDNFQQGGNAFIGKSISQAGAPNELSPFYIFIPNYSNPNIAKKAFVLSGNQMGYGANGFTFFGLGNSMVSWTKSDPIDMVTISPEKWNLGHYFTKYSYIKVFGIQDGLDT